MLQPSRIVSFHDNLPIFSGIDETRLDRCVPINIAVGMYLDRDGDYGGPRIDSLDHSTGRSRLVASSDPALNEAVAVSLLRWIATGEELPAAATSTIRYRRRRIDPLLALTRRMFHPHKYPAAPKEKLNRPDSDRKRFRRLDLAV